MAAATRKELESALRKSRRVLLHQLVIAAVGTTGIWALSWSFAFPSWIAWTLSAFSTFGAVGDALNIVFCRRALRQLDS